jgi:hypothetical protein
MALTCNAFGAITPNTYRNAMQAANCQHKPSPLQPLPPDNYRAALLAGLQQIAAQGGVTHPALGSIPECDLAAATYNLNCAIEGGRLRFPDIDADKFQAIIVYLVNQILCAGV